MDLRPRIAADIAETLLGEFEGWDTDTRATTKARWVEIILSKLVSHSIPFPNEGRDDADVVATFITKYPEVIAPLLACEEKARELWPDALLVRGLRSDPEGCHVCQEGQHLVLDILRKQPFLDPDAKADAWEDWWLDQSRGENGELFLPMLGFAPDEP
jgi:hypothetical protein